MVEDYDSTKNGMDDGKYQGARTFLHTEQDSRQGSV